MTGDLMAEDPLCTHTPGKFAGFSPSRCSRRRRTLADSHRPPADPIRSRIVADDRVGRCRGGRMKKIPAFVRGMVVEGR